MGFGKWEDRERMLVKTATDSKDKLLTEYYVCNALPDVALRSVAIPTDTDYGELSRESSDQVE